MILAGSILGKVENVKKGGFVKFKDSSKQVYIANGFCRINKRYEFSIGEDISKFIYKPKGSNCYTGFDY